MSWRERASAEAELNRLMAEQATLDRELDVAIAEAEPPG
jgi:hypothetical protein